MARKFTPPSDAPPFRVLLVEDHAIVREGLAAILSGYPAEFIVCGQAANSRTACELVAQTRPHLIILDYFLGDGEDGGRLIDELVKLCPKTRLLVLSLTDEDDLAERALRSGAHGYLVKSQGTDRLLDACRALLVGGLYMSPELQARLFDRLGSVPPAPESAYSSLTERELQVLQLLGTNLSPEVIASRLGISERTVASHRENLKNKLGHQTAQALTTAARNWLHQTRP